MPKLIFGFEPQMADWVAQRIPHVRRGIGFGKSAALGVLSDSEPARILAGVVFHNYQPDYQHAELSFASDEARWATKGIISAIFDIPFVQWKVRRLSTVTPHKNARAIKLIEGLGFKREGTLRHYFAEGDHAVIYGMLQVEYKALIARLHGTAGAK